MALWFLYVFVRLVGGFDIRWYGGVPIERRVIDDTYKPWVELYRMKLKLTRRNGASTQMEYSKGCTVSASTARGTAYRFFGRFAERQ